MINPINLLNNKYKHIILSPFLRALKKYNLLNENDKVAVCISGGKDSFLMALCFSELSKFSDIPFEAKYILMNPGYENSDLEKIKENAKTLGIDLIIKDTNIFKISSMQDKNKCYICAKMRRGALYKIAKDEGCNKIALAHHYNDVIETTLMSILYSGEVSSMRPKVKSQNYEGMELIRPMYFIKEDDIINFFNEVGIKLLKCGCFLTKDKVLCEESKRQKIKKLIKNLDDDNMYVSKNIFSSISNVNLDKLLSYKLNGEIIDLINKKD